MATKIVTKNSSTAGAAPTATDLVQGELAVNVADKRLFTEDNGGAIVELGTNPATEITANAGIALPDSQKATFGAGDDLQIYHDGGNSYIDDVGTGDLVIRGSSAVYLQKYAGENMLKATADAGVQVFYNNAEKLATTSTGIDVTGTATMDGLVVDGAGDGVKATIGKTGGTNLNIYADTNTVYLAGSPALSTAYIIDQTNNNMQFKVNAAERMRIDSSGNVGIGTSSPAYKLNVAGDMIAGGDGNSRAIGFNFYGALKYNLYMDGSTDADKMHIRKGTTNVATFDSSGNVGIGTSLPSAKVDLVGGNITGGLKISADKTTSAFFAFGADANETRITSTSYGGYKPLTVHTGGSERMRIDSSGNVGIGTSSPNKTLEVANAAGGATVSISTDQAAGSIVSKKYMNLDFTGYNNNVMARIQSWDESSSTGKGYLTFHTTPAGGSVTERMRIDASGNALFNCTTSDPVGGNVTGSALLQYGGASMSRNNTPALDLNRMTSDGEILRLRKDGTTVGSIGTISSGDLYIADGRNAGIKLDGGNNQVLPVTSAGSPLDATLDLGNSSSRFKDLYLSQDSYQRSVQLADSAAARANGYITELRTYYTDESLRLSLNTHKVISTTGYNVPSNILFHTYTGGSSSEKMRINSSGDVSIGTTQNAGYKLKLEGAGTVQLINRTGSDGALMLFQNDGLNCGEIRCSGTSTSYVTSSDQRLKDNIADADDAGSKIDSIQVRKYDWKADGSHQDYGMIAQELQAVAPEAVSGDADSEDMMGVDYSKLVPMLIKEIQSLRNRVAQLETGE